ncbi:hypothetical protein PLICRDRAFT_142622 [Plicaturopsis crispa FD-325 SS-3]|nr:hypothetical protein PLICRDRAFT_142622 [Plicaturopsis crispa FD-325 SS-3]
MVHLHVLLHGLLGDPSNLQEAARVFKERMEKRAEDLPVELLLIESNCDDGSYDGIDWGAERAVEEIDAKIAEMAKGGRLVTKFSVTGYSLGGLHARYLAGILYQRGFFDRVAPVNFATIATPHIGVVPYPGFRTALLRLLGTNLLGRTGKQLYNLDAWAKTGRPLLHVMADKELIFHRALILFQRIDIYANAVNDITVPYVSGAFEPVDPFANHVNDGLQIHFLTNYEPVIKSFTRPESPPKPLPRSWKPLPFSGPFIEWRFPLNLLLYLLLPLLIPLALMLLVTRLARGSWYSRNRVRHLERSPTRSSRLASLFLSLEKGLEQAMEDVVGQTYSSNDGPQAESHPASYLPSPDVSGATAAAHGDPEAPQGTQRTETTALSEGAWARQPHLTLEQLEMIASLNLLPNVRKHLAFIHPVRNSHGAILCRNVAFEEHRMGRGVLRHWGDNFVV